MEDTRPTLHRYDSSMVEEWNAFVAGSCNGTFLHNRRFVEYHADRFDDHSLLVEVKGKLVALLPANRVGQTLHSHGGLTYGGFIVSLEMTAVRMLEIFETLRRDLPSMGINCLVYKPVPHIFHRVPAEADIYALVQAGGHLSRCDLSSAVLIGDPPAMSKSKRQGITRALKNKLVVTEIDPVHQIQALTSFWDILKARLQEAHDTTPTHELSEMRYLHGLFPDQIRLFGAWDGRSLEAGVLVFDCGKTVHAQYMATTEKGRQTGALDLVIAHLLNTTFADRRWFNFGISTTDGGKHLNAGLSRQKEMFGARSVVFTQYQWDFG